jgi:hypothetical protein
MLGFRLLGLEGVKAVDLLSEGRSLLMPLHF